MATITTRSGKGSPLTNNEVDANFTNLNTDKLELSGGTLTGNLSLGDNVKAQFGAGDDLQIFHDGTNSYIDDAGSGSLILNGTEVRILSDDSSEYSGRFITNGAVELYYDSNKKFETKATGADITGVLTADGLTVDSTTGFSWLPVSTAGAKLGAIGTGSSVIFNTPSVNANYGSGLAIDGSYASGLSSVNIKAFGAKYNSYGSELNLFTSSGTSLLKRLAIASNGDISFYDSSGSSQNLFWDSSTSRLGLGTTAPSAPLAVHSALSGGGVIAEFRSTGNSHSIIDLRSDGTGDPKIFFDLNGATPFAIGVDNSDGDKFKISNNYNLGTNDRLTIDSAGNINIGSSLMVGSTSAPTAKLQAQVNNTATVEQIATDSNAVLLLENTNASGTAGIRLRGGNGAGVLMYGENNSTDKFYLAPRNAVEKAFTLDHVGNGVFAGTVTANAGVVVDNITIDGNDISTTNSNGNLTITPNGTGNVNINTDAVVVLADEGESASLFLAADQGDDNADFWAVTHNFSNTLTIGNQISGSIVDHITITPNATVTNSIAAFAGKITAAGSVTSAGLEVNGTRYFDSDYNVTYYRKANHTTLGYQLHRDNGNSYYEWNTGGNHSHDFQFLSNNSKILNLSTNGNVNIPNGSLMVGATTAPSGLFHAASSKGSGGDLWTQVGAGNTSAIHIQNTANAANTNAVLYFRNSVGEKASVGARFVNQSTGETELRFSTTNSSGTSRERVTIDGDGNVGIGVSDGDVRADGVSARTYVGIIGSGNRGVLNIGSTASNGADGGKITFVNGTNSVAEIYSDTDSGSQTSGSMSFTTSNQQRMKLTSGGDLLVGKTGSNVGTAGHEFLNYGRSIHTVNASTVQIINRLSNDGDLTIWQKNGTTVGSIFNSGTTMGVGSLDTGVLLANNIDAILPWNASTNAERDAAIDLGRSSGRFKDLYLSGTANVGSEVVLADSGTPKFAIGNSSNDFYIYSNAAGSERMRIDSSGRVGIGISSPSTYDSRANNLVVGDSGDSGITIFSGATRYARLQFAPSGSTGLDNGLVQYDNNDDSMAFATGGTERMRIDSSGNLLVGTTAAHPAGNNTAGMSVGAGIGLSVQGANTALTIGVPSAQTYGMAFRFQGALAGRIGIEANNITVADVSDYRLKENVAPLSDALTKIKALKPSSYNFINDPDKTHEGFIAHELQEVIPYAVSGEKDALITEATKDRGTVGEIDPQAVDLRKLVPTLVAAIQELEARITQLENN